MKKIGIICVWVCFVICNFVGCAENFTLPLSTKATQAPQSSMSQTVSASRTQAVSTSKPSALPAQSTISSSMAVSAPISSEKQTTPGGDSIEGTYRLFVKDREIATESKIELNYELRYAELPLIAIIKELGAKVEWQSKTIVKATIQERNYFLDTVKGTFVEEGNGFNLLTVAPGSKHGAIYRASGDEFIVDSDTAKLLLVNRMGAKININYEDKIVSIL